MIGAIVETMLGTFVLWKGCNPLEPLRPLVVDILTEWPTGNPHLRRHLLCFRSEVIIPAPHQPLIEPKDFTIQLEQIYYGIVVLKAVHSPDWRGHKRPGLLNLPKHRL